MRQHRTSEATMIFQRAVVLMYCALSKERNRVAKSKLILLLALTSALLVPINHSTSRASQKNNPTASASPILLKRTATRHENVRLGYGGTVTILGAPKGSVKIEGWQRNELDLTAELEWQAETQADFDLLAQVNNFAFDDDSDHIRHHLNRNA